ncbi:Imm59 family immunity protein [Listeria kieliensis]|uniref:Uncharacterized protein n=1 Tax=Listeria kieliensis TaxID=1621700 RepID=A0A3D8TQD5_9LIST|nr:Imm59 family immunity protein [Listeria kieliensis]RDX00814.1 hypothetical protein UR08_07490 [Listeria kieliensis]
MNEEIKEYKERMEDTIELLDYKALRYSLFAGENKHREEYQIRIEYIDGFFEVYVTGERASVSGVNKFDEFSDARMEFLIKAQLMILRNRRRVRDEKPTDYSCPLWDGWER